MTVSVSGSTTARASSGSVRPLSSKMRRGRRWLRSAVLLSLLVLSDASKQAPSKAQLLADEKSTQGIEFVRKGDFENALLNLKNPCR